MMEEEVQKEGPPEGGTTGGQVDGRQSDEDAFDSAKNKPNDPQKQEDFDFAAFETDLLGAPAAPKPNGGAAPVSQVVASWVYTDEHGAPLYKVDRMEDGTLEPSGKPKKTFKQNRMNGHGMDGVDRNEEWLTVLMALHWTGWPCALEIAHDWSRGSPEKYDANALDNAWKSFHPEARTGKPKR